MTDGGNLSLYFNGALALNILKPWSAALLRIYPSFSGICSLALLILPYSVELVQPFFQSDNLNVTTNSVSMGTDILYACIYAFRNSETVGYRRTPEKDPDNLI